MLGSGCTQPLDGSYTGQSANSDRPKVTERSNEESEVVEGEETILYSGFLL